MNKYLFFGYGAYRDKSRILNVLKAGGLIGDDLIVEGGYDATIDGMVLAIQDLEQIPEPARTVLLRVWGEKFRAYTMKPGKGQVAGVVWELNEKQYDVIKEWEFDGIWREMTEVDITTSDQRKLHVITERVVANTPTRKIVDGINYENNLNKSSIKPLEDAEDEYRIKEMERVRQELSRQSKTNAS